MTAPSPADRPHKLFLLDGMALVYRAHFAFAVAPIRTAAGRNTSAIYGFANTLLELITKFAPTHLAVVFDTSAPTARHAEFSDYKAQREEMPEELSAAIPDVKRLIRAFNLPCLELDGYEADDIIGTLAREAEANGYTTYMVTPDKDFGQLVDANTFIYRPSRAGDGAEILGVAEVLAKWGVERVEQVIDILGLWGDTSDNIPGVPGIGEKTAQKLIAQFGSVENLLANTGQLKGKQKESLEAHREQALLSKRLATINVQVPIPFDDAQLKIGPRDDETLKALLSELEFNSLGKRLYGEAFKAGRGYSGGAEKATKAEISVEGEPLAPPTAPVQAALKTLAEVTVDYQTGAAWEQTVREKMTSLSVAGDLSAQGKLRGIAWSIQPGVARYVSANFADFFQALPEGIQVIGHDLKPLLRALAPLTKRNVTFFDTALAHALVYPEVRHGLDFVAEALLGYTPMAESPAKGQQDFFAELSAGENEAAALGARRAMERADLAGQLHAILAPQLEQAGQLAVFRDLEAPLLPILAEMEAVGIRLDPSALKEVEEKLRGELTRLEASIYQHAGTNFNIGSPKQLGDILFDKLVLGTLAGFKPKKTKTGQYATDEQTLQTLAPLHPIVGEILEHREASKLLSTYVLALPETVAADGRIHTTYQQLATSTGRLNSNEPNLQNIPIRTAQGREIRRAFVPRDAEHVLLSADYSQIELRILAALTQDPGLLEGLAGDSDIHRTTAARVYGVAVEDVTKEQRSKAKMVNYGISYGISAFGLAQRLSIPRAEAKALIDGYFAQFPGIKNYMTQTVELGRARGYVETITGRRRYLPDLRSSNATVRAAAERNAINMPIQGTSADLIKRAMVDIAAVAHAENWRTKLLLQVHDELVFDLYLPEKERVLAVVPEKMQHALPQLQVPILVEVGLGQNWLEAH